MCESVSKSSCGLILFEYKNFAVFWSNSLHVCTLIKLMFSYNSFNVMNVINVITRFHAKFHVPRSNG